MLLSIWLQEKKKSMDSSAILRGEQMPCEIEVHKTGDMFKQQIAEPVSWSKNCDFDMTP